jgi:Uma2 family endonuclease
VTGKELFMARVGPPPATEYETAAELLDALGGIPPERILMQPPPGTATERDVTAAEGRPRKRICELIDGVLVEKALSFRKALLGVALGGFMHAFLDEHDLGILLGPGGKLRLSPGLVRTPDISFISWDRLPGGQLPDEAIPDLIPSLAVEILIPGNTAGELQRKLRDYSRAGVEVTWLIDLQKQTAEAYTVPDRRRRIGKNGSLDGGTVLPGFRLPLKQLFAETVRRPKR